MRTHKRIRYKAHQRIELKLTIIGTFKKVSRHGFILKSLVTLKKYPAKMRGKYNKIKNINQNRTNYWHHVDLPEARLLLASASEMEQ